MPTKQQQMNDCDSERNNCNGNATGFDDEQRFNSLAPKWLCVGLVTIDDAGCHELAIMIVNHRHFIQCRYIVPPESSAWAKRI